LLLTAYVYTVCDGYGAGLTIKRSQTCSLTAKKPLSALAPGLMWTMEYLDL